MPTEGGIRVPMVLRYPPIAEHHKLGSVTHVFATVMDIMPTILSSARVLHPNAQPATPTSKTAWRDRQVYPMRGRDWLPYLLHGRSDSTMQDDAAGDLVQQTETLVGRRRLFITPGEDQAIWGPEAPAVGWEMHGRAAVRKGRWKIVNVRPDFWGTDHWQLCVSSTSLLKELTLTSHRYDLETDQGEINDLALRYPERLNELLVHWRRYQEETGSYLRREQSDMPPTVVTEGERNPGQKAWLRVPIGESLPWTSNSLPVE